MIIQTIIEQFKLRRLLIIFLLVSNLCFAKQYQNGLILPDFEKLEMSEVCCVYLPQEGFTVFNSPGGENIGYLTKLNERNDDDQAPYKIYFIDKTTKTLKQIDLSILKEIDYEIWAITYFERKNGYVRILDNNVGYWLNENDIEEKNFKIENWKTFLIANKDNLLGYYANDPGLNLQLLPSKDSDVIVILKGDLYEIIPTEQSQTNWVKVKVKKYKEHPCESGLNEDELIEENYKGWIELVEDNGMPNVWYYSRGC